MQDNFNIILKAMLILRAIGKLKKNDVIIATLLNYNPSFNQNMVVKASFIDKSSVSKALKRLIDEKLISKNDDGSFSFNSDINESLIVDLIQKYHYMDC